jgi:hypothetical protein
MIPSLGTNTNGNNMDANNVYIIKSKHIRN